MFRTPRRARRLLLDILEGELRPEDIGLDVADPDLRSVVNLVDATVGIEVNEVSTMRVALDDVREILAAVAEGRDLPMLSALESNEDLAHLRSRVAELVAPNAIRHCRQHGSSSSAKQASGGTNAATGSCLGATHDGRIEPHVG